jgi:limonene-1,2-epoxide hydrolase
LQRAVDSRDDSITKAAMLERPPEKHRHLRKKRGVARLCAPPAQALVVRAKIRYELAMSLANVLPQSWLAINDKGEAALDDLIKLYDDGIFWVDPLQTLLGIQHVEAFFRTLFRRSSGFNLSIVSIVEGENVAHIAWKLHWTPRFAPAQSIDGASFLRVKEGKIIYQQNYFDLLTSGLSALPLGNAIFQTLVKPVIG